MKTINKTEVNQKLLRNMLKMFASCLLMAQLIFVSSAFGQGASLGTTAVYSDQCPTAIHCCQLITFTAGGNTDHLSIQVTGGVDPSCWNWGCQKSNPAANVAFTTKATGDGWDITFGPNPLGIGQTVQIMLCPVDNKEACAYAYTSITWSADLVGPPPIPQGNGTTPILGCTGTNDIMCPTCDRVDMTTPNTCYERFCITRHWPVSNLTSGKTFVLRIKPKLKPCNITQTGCPVTSIQMDNTEFPGWTANNPVDGTLPNGDTYTDIPLTHTGDLGGCGTVCINIPKCHDPNAPSNPITHTVTVNNPDDPYPCNPVSAAFKTVGTTQTITAENFPNPLTRTNQFKTTIPFELSQNGGSAKISIINVDGKTVYQDVQEFAGSGKHFFYFTGEQLPSGKYFYTIESPIGTVIMNKSLLIVK